MILIQYRNGCRNCNQSNGMQGVIQGNENIEFYQNLTDYEVSKLITKTLSNNGIDCEFCGENNWDLSSINVNNLSIFDLRKLKREFGIKGKYIFIYSVRKMNSQMNLDVDNGDSYPNSYPDTRNFEKRSKSIIQNLINSIPTSEFTHHSNGIFYMCFTGTNTEIKLEKFRHVGFTKEVLINITNNIAKNPFD